MNKFEYVGEKTDFSVRDNSFSHKSGLERKINYLLEVYHLFPTKIRIRNQH